MFLNTSFVFELVGGHVKSLVSRLLPINSESLQVYLHCIFQKLYDMVHS